MNFIRTLMPALLLLSSAVVTYAQSEQSAKGSPTPDPTIAVSSSDKGLRFAALGSVGQMRLEIFNTSGDLLYSSEFQPGNVRDWGLKDKSGQSIPDGSYVSVVTVRDFSGKLSLKQGTVLLRGGHAALKLGEVELGSAADPQNALSPVADDNANAIGLLTHNGADGQIVSTRGGLTFKLGDFFAGSERELMRLTPEGNLGIGMTHPTAKLDVEGLIRAGKGIIFPDGSVQLSAARKTLGASSVKLDQSGRISSLNQELAATPTLAAGTQNRISKFVDGSGTLGDSIVTDTGFLAIDSNSNPQAAGTGTLIIQGSVNKERIELRSSGSTPGPALQGKGFGGTIDSPTPTLANSDMFIIGGSGFNGTSLVLFNAATIKIKAEQDWTATANGAFINFETTPSGSPTSARLERMRITGDGKVGIGTTTPTVALDVAGDIRASHVTTTGFVAAAHQDVAEWVPAHQKVDAGTVVSVDLELPNVVRPSTSAYDTHVAGVVSEKPGLILGEGGEGKVMVATTGRVKVKVDATRHPIKIGDLLVTSGREGVAMKSQPIKVSGTLIHRPGTIIGKALEPLTKGQGEILVLLSLQ